MSSRSVADPAPDAELVAHLVRSSGLERQRAAHIVSEVIAAHDETVEAFVRRRHRELQATGLANAQIYPRIGEELAGRRFAAPALSERQLRRLVYG